MKISHKNPTTQELVKELKKLAIEQKAGLWKRIAVELEKSTRSKRVVNISRINRHSGDNEIIIVPGKVLSSGELNHRVTVCAQAFSEEATKKISQKGKILTIQELMKQNPKGSNIRIIG